MTAIEFLRAELDATMDALAKMIEERDAIAKQLGAEVARSQEWMRKFERAQRRADAVSEVAYAAAVHYATIAGTMAAQGPSGARLRDALAKLEGAK